MHHVGGDADGGDQDDPADQSEIEPVHSSTSTCVLSNEGARQQMGDAFDHGVTTVTCCVVLDVTLGVIGDLERELVNLEREVRNLEREVRNFEREVRNLEREVGNLEREVRNLECEVGQPQT